MDETAAEPRFTRRQKLATGLGTAASAATVLTLILTLGGSSSSQPPQPAQQTQAAYPASIQVNFLNGCEMSASVAQCSCLLGFFEANVPLARFGQDDALAAQGQVTADLRDAENACPSSLSQSVGV